MSGARHDELDDEHVRRDRELGDQPAHVDADAAGYRMGGGVGVDRDPYRTAARCLDRRTTVLIR